MSASREAYLSKLYLDRTPREDLRRDRSPRSATATPGRRQRSSHLDKLVAWVRARTMREGVS